MRTLLLYVPDKSIILHDQSRTKSSVNEEYGHIKTCNIPKSLSMQTSAKGLDIVEVVASI